MRRPGLGSIAARGAVVTLASQVVRVVLQLTSVIVLSRLLTPHDYGLVAIALVVIGIGEIFRDFGLSSAAIQAPSLSRAQRDNLFWTNAAIGLGLAALCWGLSWPVAALTRQEEVRGICQALAVTFVLNGLATQYRASSLRAMRFRALAGAEILATVLALAMAIAAAAAGWGYWALVAQQLAQGVLMLVLLAAIARWVPRLPQREGDIRGFVSLGWNLVLSQLVNYAANNADTVMIGVRYGPTSLGIYNRAYQLVMTPLHQVRTPLTTVALPILSRIQTERDRFSDYIACGQLALGYTLCLGLGVVAALADPLTLLFLGEQWAASAPLLRLLALAAIAQTLAFVGYWVYVSRGLGGALFRYSLVSAAIRVTCILAGSFGGVLGVAVGFAVAPFIAWPISLAWLSRTTTIPTRRLFAGAFRILAMVLVTGCAAFGASALVEGHLAQLLVGVGAAAAACLAMVAIPAYQRDLATLLEVLRLLRRSRMPAPSP